MSKLRGCEIKLKHGEWVYSDDGLPTVENWMKKPCGHCGLQFTKAGHDGCLGALPHVMNACCGHGIDNDAYTQNLDGNVTSGVGAIKRIELLQSVFSAMRVGFDLYHKGLDNDRKRKILLFKL